MSTIHLQRERTPNSWAWLIAFLIVVIGVGGLIGTQSAPAGWYASLQKPPFNPPNWLFAPVWFTLYVLIAIAGWRTFTAAPRSPAMGLWVAQMLLNWAWTPVWFTLHQIWPALAIIVALDLVVLAFIGMRWRSDRTAAVLFVPYLAWITFATLLNLAIGILNPA